MKLAKKLILIFIFIIIISSVIIILGLPSLFSKITERQMKKEAQTFGLFLLKNIEAIALDKNLNYNKEEQYIEKLIYKEFEKAIKISNETESFLVDEIILIESNYKVEVGYPEDQKDLDYSSHKDIVENFNKKSFNIVLEKHAVNGQNKLELDIDIVSFLMLNNEPRVLEIKLNFKKTLELLRKQYRNFEIISISISFFIILILLGILLFIIKRTAINPVIKMSNALEVVGKGDLNISVNHKSNDEFGLMSRRFNEMVIGLKEKLHLSKYVSKSTINAVSNAVKSGKEFHKPQRKKLTVFFSDIRDFTKYSEKKSPEYIIKILNKILSIQAIFIKNHGGYIDKFVGDETMAIFENTKEAIICALYIQSKILKSANEFNGLKIGIGIYEGNVVEGDVGSDETKDFTIIGDTVNTASRLQSVAEGGEIIVPSSIVQDDFISKRFKYKLKGNIKLKGKENELELYKIIGLKK